MSQERLNDELAAIEAALCSLTPAASGIDRDRLMFLAGKTAGNRGTRRRLAATFWPLATAASLVVAATFGVLWAADHSSGLGQPPAGSLFAGVPLAVDVCGEAPPLSPWANRSLCQLLLEKGGDALPEATSHGVSGVRLVPPDQSYRSLLKQFLDNPSG
jgi:hypothetical protein